MRLLIFLLSFLGVISCSAPAEKPDPLLSKNQMAEIIVDLAIYNQTYTIDPKLNLEEANLFVLQKHHIKAEDFKKSYEYYTFSPTDLDDIYNKAKKIILEKDPTLKEKLNSKNNTSVNE